ncbi:hypothetical protein [Nodularia spumigena]|nr:hypothetical protein [Nodularia spumigena]MDB9317504.1 hypothetical protein [Nodularia spumigena CS-590/01A]MDB9323413.1 hypothetical protein [Nodularia spumigena CS-591/07A]MDB9532257.1 hypothetical protein [Nodularia spumigena CS-1038]
MKRTYSTFHVFRPHLDSSGAPLRLCVRQKNVVHLPENRCK